MRSRRRELFRALICMARGTITPPPNRDDAAPFRVCVLLNCNPHASGDAAEPGTSSATTMISVGSGGGDAHKSERIKRITVGKSVLFDSTIYILCRVAECQAS